MDFGHFTEPVCKEKDVPPEVSGLEFPEESDLRAVPTSANIKYYAEHRGGKGHTAAV